MIAKAHKLLEPYKNKHAGEECIIFGTGPTLKGFDQTTAQGKTLMGSNEIVYYELLMDYYLIGDAGTAKRGYNSDPQVYNEYTPNFFKFCRQPEPRHKRLSGYNTLPRNIDSFTYFITDGECYRARNPYLMNTIRDVGCVSLELAQLAVFLGFKTIYLVGQDCDYSQGSYKSSVSRAVLQWSKCFVTKWRLFADYLAKKHPHVNVYNINPVGLIGVFDDY